MTNRFLISVAAAALIVGTGFANAQGTGGRFYDAAERAAFRRGFVRRDAAR